MVLSDTQILAGIQSGQVVCFPFVADNVRGSSIDVRLGANFYATDREGRVSYNPRDPADVARYFKPFTAQPHHEVCAHFGIAPFKNIPADHPIIVLRPHERVLAHTYEFVGIHPPGTSEMRARSSTGRNGIVVCKCAGWGDPGYIGRWTMEIQNDNDCYYPLMVGERIAQVVLHHTGEVARPYGQAGKYQSGDDVRELVRLWEPSLMLPRSYTDVITAPLEPTVPDLEEYLRQLSR